jgi:hypothetical protein
MAINYNRDGIIGINLPSQNNNYQNVAFKPGSLKDNLIKQLYNIEQNTGFSNPKLDQLKQEDMQQFQDKGTPLSLPSDAYTANLRNLNDRMTDVPIRLSRNLDYDLINKVREYNPNYDRYTDQEITELGIPIFNKTMPSSMNSGVTNANNFRSMLLDDLRNLPSDFRTSLGQTKDALVEDFSGLGSFLKDKSIQGFDFAKQIPGMAISAITGVPLLGQGLVSLFSGMKESPEEKAARDFYEKKYGLTNTGQVASGIMQGYNPVSLFGGPGLLNSIDKRLATILRTEQGKNKKGLELSQELINRRKELENLRAQESAAASDLLESQRRGRRPETGGGGPGISDKGAPAGTGGYSYDSGGRQGFGYGL